jgi:carbonic anhydrase
MERSFTKALKGYREFRSKYAHGDKSIMDSLATEGQKPDIMVVSCCDSRVDPALILNCDPGDLFVVRNVANIVPPYEKDNFHHGTSAALEFGVCMLKVKHLILLSHSQCGGIAAAINSDNSPPNDFINSWVSIIKHDVCDGSNTEEYTKAAMKKSYKNCLTFPWIVEKLEKKELLIHSWFFDIKTGQIFTYSEAHKKYVELDSLETTFAQV